MIRGLQQADLHLSLVLPSINGILFVAFSSVFFFAVLAAVNFFFFICQEEYMIQPLLDGSDAAGVFAFDHIGDLFWKLQLFFVNDLFVLDDIDGDIVVNKAKDIQIQLFDRTFNFDDIFSAHFVASGIFDDGNCTVQLVQLQVIDRSSWLCRP